MSSQSSHQSAMGQRAAPQQQQQQSEARNTSLRDNLRMEVHTRDYNGIEPAIATNVPPTVGAGARRKRKQYMTGAPTTALLLLAASIPLVSTQACISLSGSTQCPAFNASSISTGPTLTGFLWVDLGWPNFRPLTFIVLSFPSFQIHKNSMTG